MSKSKHQADVKGKLAKMVDQNSTRSPEQLFEKSKSQGPSRNTSGQFAPAQPKEVAMMAGMKHVETIIAENGQFIKIETPFGNALVRDTRIVVPAIQPTLIPSGLKIPRRIFEATLTFFRAIRERSRTEAVVLFYHNKKTKDWQIVVPPQKATGGDVSYEYKDLTKLINLETDQVASILPHEGWILAGTSHSHPANAFWSPGDDANEFPINGFHITMGYLDQPVPDLKCSIVVRMQRFELPANQVFDFGDETGFVPGSSVMENVITRDYNRGSEDQPRGAWLPKEKGGAEVIPAHLLEQVGRRDIEGISHRANATDLAELVDIPEGGFSEDNPDHVKLLDYMAHNGYEYDPEHNKFQKIGNTDDE